MIFLVDHNFKGHARILFGSIASQGWLDFVPIRFVMFEEVGLSIDSNDRVVWRIENSVLIGLLRLRFTLPTTWVQDEFSFRDNANIANVKIVSLLLRL